MGIDYDFSGLNFGDLTARILEHAPTAIALGLEHIKTVVTPLVPLETGQLAGSGDVSAVGLEGKIYYPGPYALYQEEGVYYRHGRFGAPLTHTHGQSFFLAIPMVTEADAALRVVADELWRSL